MSCTRLLLLFLVVGSLRAGEVLETDQWFVGHLNGQPAMTMHAVVTRHPDGKRSDALDSTIVINRALGGNTIRLSVHEAQNFQVGADGRIVSFTFDHTENDQPVSAVGKVEGDQVIATVHRLGRATETSLTIPPGTTLLGQQASQELLAKRVWHVGDKESFATVALVSNQVQIVSMTATFQQRTENGDLTFGVVMDLMPLPTTMTITPKGDLVAMAMDMGFIKLAFKPSAGPVPLAGAELAADGLVTAKGPAPAAGPTNRYRIPAGGGVAEDEFQHIADGVVTVLANTEPAPLADPAVFLRAEPQLEIDDPVLRTWVTGIAVKHADPAELAEHLRLAVRALIVVKDLSTADGSALETFRSHRGDCTEHANLLAAALRIAGIPSRVEQGVVYADTFGGWVGHAWNSGYVGGRWVHLDSAYPGLARSCYLKLGTTSGGEWKNTGAAMLGNFGRIMGKEIETLKP